MRIAPRTMLCATDFQAQAVQESRGRFAELRELCAAAGDKVSLAIGMTGLATELLYTGRSREGSRLASEQMALLESIGDPTLTIGLAFVAFGNWSAPVNSASSCGGRRPSSTWPMVIPPRAPASVSDHRWRPRWQCAALLGGGCGRPEWRQDLDDAVAMARNSDPTTFAGVVPWTYGYGMQYGVLRADDSAVRMIEEAVQTAGATGNDLVGLGRVRGWVSRC